MSNMANQDTDQDLISVEEWLKFFTVCGNDAVDAAAHILASIALAVKKQLNELAHELENSQDDTLLSHKDEILRGIHQVFSVEIEDFAHSGKNALISVDFVDNQEDSSQKPSKQRHIIDLEKADDADLPYGLSKEELANLLQTLDTVVAKPEFQKVRRIEVGVMGSPADKDGKPLDDAATATFHCAIFDADKFELVRKSDRQAERHLGSKKPVFH